MENNQEPEVKPTVGEETTQSSELGNTPATSVDNETARGETSVIQHVDELGYTKGADETAVAEPVAEPTVAPEELVEAKPQPEPEISSPAPRQVKQGTVVSGTSSALGKSAGKENEKRILSQPSTVVAPVLNAFDLKLKTLEETGTSQQKTIISTLKRYLKEMPCGVEVPTETARLQQRALWNTILSIIGTDDDFRANWRLLVSFFRHYSTGSFGDKYVNRYMDHMSNFKANELQTFVNVLALLSITASTPNVKDVQKMIVLQRALTSPIKGEAQQRVINFYS